MSLLSRWRARRKMRWAVRWWAARDLLEKVQLVSSDDNRLMLEDFRYTHPICSTWWRATWIDEHVFSPIHDIFCTGCRWQNRSKREWGEWMKAAGEALLRDSTHSGSLDDN